MSGWLLAILCAFLLLLPASAHSGRTDSRGGHYNRSTGEYHYHHGYPAHQHDNNECPYDFDDETGKNSGSSGGNSAGSSRPAEKKEDAAADPIGIVAFLAAFARDNKGAFAIIVAVLVSFLLTALVIIYDSIQRRRREAKLLEAQRLEAAKAAAEEAARRAQRAREEEAARRARAEERRIAEREKFLQEQAEYRELYEGKPLELLAGIPPGFEISPDRLPREANVSEGWGARFTMYITHSGKCYHRRCGCCTATTPIHILNTRRYRACSKCYPPTSIDIPWYDEYLRIAAIKRKYNIE